MKIPHIKIELRINHSSERVQPEHDLIVSAHVEGGPEKYVAARIHPGEVADPRKVLVYTQEGVNTLLRDMLK